VPLSMSDLPPHRPPHQKPLLCSVPSLYPCTQIPRILAGEAKLLLPEFTSSFFIQTIHPCPFLLKWILVRILRRNVQFGWSLTLWYCIHHVHRPVNSILKCGWSEGLDHPRRGSAKPSMNNITNLCSDMFVTCTATLSNSAMKAFNVPICLNYANSWKEIFGSLLSNLSISLCVNST
jgi:hypothetical protein